MHRSYRPERTKMKIQNAVAIQHTAAMNETMATPTNGPVLVVMVVEPELNPVDPEQSYVTPLTTYVHPSEGDDDDE